MTSRGEAEDSCHQWALATARETGDRQGEAIDLPRGGGAFLVPMVPHGNEVAGTFERIARSIAAFLRTLTDGYVP